jgi:phage virion morphogenesis protein
MSIAIRLASKDLGAVVARMNALALRMGDYAPVLQQFGLAMLRSVEKTFQAGGRPNRWVPWALSTSWRETRSVLLKSGKVSSSAKRTGRARTGKVLIDTARLKNSITASLAGTGPSSVLRIGSNVIYARIHQLGGRAGRGHKSLIPARPYLVVQAEDLELLKRMVREHLTGSAG